MKIILVTRTIKSVFFTIFLVVLFMSVQVGIARADLIDVAGNPWNLNPWGVTAITGNGVTSFQHGYGSVWSPESQPGFIDDTTWSFITDPQLINGAYVSQSSSVIYNGSSLTARGRGAVSTTGSNDSNSSFILDFTPSINTPFNLSLSLLGDIFQAGWYTSGAVSFTAYPPGSSWYSLIVDTSGCTINCGAIMSPVTLDLAGTLNAGVNYRFSIGANASLANAYYTAPPTVNSASAEWNFNLSLSPTSVPEPATMLLLGLGLLGLAGVRRKLQ
jgi:hypothetical protein